MNDEFKSVIILVISLFLFLLGMYTLENKEIQQKQEICFEAVKLNNPIAINIFCEKI